MIREFLLIFVVNYIGVILTEILHLPIPGTISGMLLLFALLYFKILKLSHIEKAGNFLLLNMTIFFLPPSVSLIENISLLKTGFLKIIFLVVISTLITMVVTAITVQYLIERGERR